MDSDNDLFKSTEDTMNEVFKTKCPYCIKDDFKSESGLNRHIARIHPNIEEEQKRKEEKAWKKNQPIIVAEFVTFTCNCPVISNFNPSIS